MPSDLEKWRNAPPEERWDIIQKALDKKRLEYGAQGSASSRDQANALNEVFNIIDTMSQKGQPPEYLIKLYLACKDNDDGKIKESIKSFLEISKTVSQAREQVVKWLPAMQSKASTLQQSTERRASMPEQTPRGKVSTPQQPIERRASAPQNRTQLPPVRKPGGMSR